VYVIYLVTFDLLPLAFLLSLNMPHCLVGITEWKAQIEGNYYQSIWIVFLVSELLIYLSKK